MMSIKSQIVKEFFRESYAPLWKEVRVGKDCDSMCRAKWERLKKEDTEYRKGLYESGRQDTRRGFKYVGFQDSENFEDYHKRLRETAKGKWSDDCTAFGVQRKPFPFCCFSQSFMIIFKVLTVLKSNILKAPTSVLPSRFIQALTIFRILFFQPLPFGSTHTITIFTHSNFFPQRSIRFPEKLFYNL
jgi:hypothetical protein